MKTTLNWYKREANSYSSTAMRLLIKAFNYKGAYLYISLCDTLVTLPNCVLDLKNDTDTVELLCLDIGFEQEKFNEFINKLLKYKLLIELGSFKYSTPEIQESLTVTMEERAKAYFRKYKKHPIDWVSDDKTNSSPELSESSGELSESSGEQTRVRPTVARTIDREREKEEKPKKKEKQEREALASLVFNKDFLNDLKENFDLDKNDSEKYQDSFLKFFKMTKKTWKDENDFRSHFLNWLKLELKSQKNAKTTDKVGERQDY